jgi:hypothetical protein
MKDWIYIKEGDESTYPKNNDEVLVWDEGRGYVPCSYYEGEFFDGDDNKLRFPLAWVLMPEPPSKIQGL